MMVTGSGQIQQTLYLPYEGERREERGEGREGRGERGEERGEKEGSRERGVE